MTKPTEGPYHWTDGDKPIDINTYTAPGYYRNPELRGKDGRDVIGCDEYWIIGPFGNDDEMRANARLLAASWEMREALALWKASDEETDEGARQVARQIARERRDALLARIDGETE